MELQLLLDNLTNPALLFFFLGLLAVQLKSDLEIPGTSSKFISLYLLFSIGFKGGQELAHSQLDSEIMWSLLFGILLALVIPLYTFFFLKRKLGVWNAGAIAASYGSVSAVTFVTSVSFLEMLEIDFGGHMVAVMALMEAPSIIVGVLLLNLFNKEVEHKVSFGHVLKHALTNGSVILIIGSLIIGFLANDAQAQGIEPFTTDIFKGFLAVFLLDMGITSGKKLASFLQNGWFALAFAIIVPLINGCVVAVISQWVTSSEGNQFLFAILAASASYIAVPAAMKLAAPKANPSLYLPMALAITFPLNITLGMPLYLSIIHAF
ncbi:MULTISPECIES: sodium-dependent bicarbonate transport family permease [Roseivirga]|uniref:Sodium-dependent bicarbonate transport family permease n=1 Tax=Roseivirga spongicola TaxID=333140 RepID=A0A150XAR3_9BACT|nr:MULTISPECIES: sodium-dependent bicarbonate transport family permease [Roseivirga]KYG75764.1 sodium-dependent bicarbonate transport family permease [Roseivirga spongicola]MBO6495967.1 sodium-dependent bicarbonate transport family permease [Roseivirga sp.]MBO6662531.1 sodium-dependent bicarbonate transport family permease [Roseivirga sp.]MBO6761707.1 sodium-dependent bicarbonate transport family permease [Roseivirga sp.]MBO6909906.1 sodium-dependent bicarbonate transport family permease [Rose